MASACLNLVTLGLPRLLADSDADQDGERGELQEHLACIVLHWAMGGVRVLSCAAWTVSAARVRRSESVSCVSARWRHKVFSPEIFGKVLSSVASSLASSTVQYLQ